MTLPLWIRSPVELTALVTALDGVAAVAIDTEADSLHHYPGKLCLVQLADDRGGAHLIDPLAFRDLSALGPVCDDAGVVKVLHAADNDLAYLKRLYGFTVASLFDTAIAARFLGVTALSLDGLLRQYLGIEPGKSRQKDDWSRRPLSAEQEAYALNDVLHLIALRARLLEALQVRGRARWVEEECAAVAATEVHDRPVDPDAYLGLKGSKELDRRGLAVLRELYQARETLALKLGRPPFMVLGNEGLVRLAALGPRDANAILGVPGCTPTVVRRFGEAILEAVARGQAVPDSDLPVRPRVPRPAVPVPVRRRAEGLRAWRVEASERLGLDPGTLLPQRLIDRLAAEPPADLDALARTDGVRRWRAELFGDDLLEVLGATR